MRKILGLDLGSSSIGWAVINENETNSEHSIVAMGSRIVPFDTKTDKSRIEFSQGQDITKNAKRTAARTARKGLDRYELRRTALTNFLRTHGMLPTEELIKLDKIKLWQFRSKGVYEQLTPQEIGRVLYHLNQKRGYKSAREDSSNKEEKDYVKVVNGRHATIKELGMTIGEYFCSELSKNKDFRTKEQVFPRAAYIEEFDRIIDTQRKFYPNVLTERNIDTLRNKIIYYQRSLKSCKHLVSICEFEKRAYTNNAGKVVWNGPKTASKSSPLAQVCKIWESINNIRLSNRKNDEFFISLEDKRRIFEHLDSHGKLTATDLQGILRIKKSDGWNANIAKGIQGNTTKHALRIAGGEYVENLLEFRLKKEELVDKETGEVREIISENYQNEPLHRLWHLLYSIKDIDELAAALEKQFGIRDRNVVNNLFNIDFTKAGYANKSAKAMRRILPYLEEGYMYSDACEAAGFRHSESLSKTENQSRELKTKLEQIPKNELRQPVVEKILNQMINVVNALIEKHGTFDEIRIELARELKQSKEERNKTTKRIGKNETENKRIAAIITQYGYPTRSRIQKYKMWEESQQKCFYCGATVNVSEFLRGFDVDVEHIIPRSLFADDSFSNKVCACRDCNKEKGNKTAYDFMNGKSDAMFEDYLHRIDEFFKSGKITKTKRDRLLTPVDKIPADFIDRQLRESQYIAKKSREILSSVCRDVTATSGGVTSRLRYIWGYDNVLHKLNFDRYKAAGLTEIKERKHNGSSWSEEVIKDWSKRLDHRHHAVDALVVALTKQGYIQKMNNLSQFKSEYEDVKFDNYIASQPHPTVAEVGRAVAGILVSFKAGKKASVPGKRFVHKNGKRIAIQQGIVVPRGALHEESVYGMITMPQIGKKGEMVMEPRMVLRYPLTSIVRKDIEYIVDKKIRALVQERFDNHQGAEKDVWKDLAGNPMLFNGTPVKRVRCFAGPHTPAFAKIERGYVKMGNNHHVAIYVDSNGKYHERCVTLWSAVERKKYGVPIIVENPAKTWGNLTDGVPEKLLNELPEPTWQFVVSLQQNEMFILGLEPEAFEEAMREGNYALLNKHLYRVQSVSPANYWFRLHVETLNDKTPEGKLARKFIRCQNLKGFFEQHPQKVYINLLGEIKKL